LAVKKTKTKFRATATYVLMILGALGVGFISVKPLDAEVNRIRTNIKDQSIIKETEKYAGKYIKDKYGFKAEKIECADKIGNVLFGKAIDLSKNDSLALEAVYRGKHFSLSAYDFSDDAIPDFYDNYQEENIKNCLDTYLNTIDPECKIVETRLYSSGVEESEENLFMFGSDEILDETESEQFIEKCSGYVELAVSKKTSAANKLSEVLSEYGIECTLTNFDNTQNMYDYISKYNKDESVSFSEYAPHITERTINSSSEKHTVTNSSSLYDSGEFKYAYFVNDELYSDSSVILKPVTSSDSIETALSALNKEVNLNNRLTRLYLNDSLILDDTVPQAVIYYPLNNNGRSVNADKIALVCCQKDSEEKPEIIYAEKCGDYAVFDLPTDQDVFQIFSLE